MKISNRLVGVLIAVLVIAAALFVLRSCGAGDSPDGATAKPTPTAVSTTPKIPSTSTGYISTKIKERLETVTGRPMKITCPERVDLVKGTDMACKVFYADKDVDTQIAEATVTMTDNTGKFSWKSNPV